MNKIICRKCGGEHLTIKCGRELETTIVKEIKQDTPKQDSYKQDSSKQDSYKQDSYKQDYKSREYSQFKHKYSKVYTVKLSDLPIDISEPELYELLENWGHITKVRVLMYEDNSSAYIDFCSIDEASYFVRAIHKTPFDSFIISAELCAERRT